MDGSGHSPVAAARGLLHGAVWYRGYVPGVPGTLAKISPADSTPESHRGMLENESKGDARRGRALNKFPFVQSRLEQQSPWLNTCCPEGALPSVFPV